MEAEQEAIISDTANETSADATEQGQDLREAAKALLDNSHPFAKLFPLMEGDEYAGLVEDIRLNGLRDAIWVDQHGRILDGRNRMRACMEAGVPCKRQTFEGDDAAILRFVISRNLHRRHLDASQRALIAAELANIKSGEFAGNQHVPSANLQRAQLSQTAAANLMNVSPRSVADAVKVRNEGEPELFQAVKEGKLKVSRAAKTAKASTGKTKTLTDGKGETRRKSVDIKAKRKPLPAAQASTAQATAHELSSNIRQLSRQIVDGVRARLQRNKHDMSAALASQKGGSPAASALLLAGAAGID